ncbi:MAG: DUF1565 domain-containing protein, partial [Chloroflexota bacterium]
MKSIKLLTTLFLALSLLFVIFRLLPHSPAFAAGTTYFVNATTGDDTRSTAQAQSSVTPWKTITHAVATVPAGVLGNPNIIQVAAGTHNAALGEAFPIVIDTAYLRLSGAGRDNTIVDAGGGGHDIFQIAADGIHIEGFAIQNSARNGIDTEIAGFTIQNNHFTAVDVGVEFTMNELHAGQTFVISDVTVINNSFEVRETGVEIDIDLLNGFSYAAGAIITMGQVNILSNTILKTDTDDYGIYYDTGIAYIENGQITIDEITIANNRIDMADDGIYVEADAEHLTGTTTLNAKNLTITGNTLHGYFSDSAIEIEYYGDLDDLYGSSRGSVGDILVSHNVISHTDYGIYLAQVAADNIHHDVDLNYGNVTIENNEAYNAASEHITFRQTGVGGFYNNAKLTIGSSTIQSNTIINYDTSGAHGILIEQLRFGQNLHNAAMITTGNTLITNNLVINRDGRGIYLVYGHNTGIRLYNNASLFMGTTTIVSNTIQQADDYSGIDIFWDRSIQ